MPSQGQIIIDQFTGNTIEFLETANDTKGERVTLKISQKTNGQMVDDHTHVLQVETFRVISGRMTYFLDGEKKFLTAGEEITLPKNVPHNHYNTDDEPVEYIQTITPALDIDYFVENVGGLINDGKVKNGKLPFLQGMVTLKYLDSPTYLANIPVPVQRILSSILAPFARAIGYRAIYKKYTGIEK